MIPRKQPEKLKHYITCLHEAAHILVTYRSTNWMLRDPCVVFPRDNPEHLARTKFGPKNKELGWTKDVAREYVKLGMAGYFGQNLIDNSAVLSEPGAGCEDDREFIEERLRLSGLEQERMTLARECKALVLQDQEVIFSIAEVIYNSRDDVRLDVIIKAIESYDPTNDSEREKTKNDFTEGLPRDNKSAGEPDKKNLTSYLFGWVASLFSKKTR